MKKVDRLGWPVGFSLKSYGVRIGIRSNDPAALDRVCEHLPREWERATSTVVDRVYSILVGGQGPRANVRRFNLLYGDHLQLARSLDLDSLFDRFESDLRIFVAEWAKHRVFVHAGVVGWKGKAIVIPGRSFSGKSTLVAELVRAGLTIIPMSMRSWIRAVAFILFPNPSSCARKVIIGNQKSRWLSSAATPGLSHFRSDSF